MRRSFDAYAGQLIYISLLGALAACEPAEEAAYDADASEPAYQDSEKGASAYDCSAPGGSGCSGATVTLPIEVLGPQGTRKDVTIDIGDPTGITHLYIRCNSCGYHNHDLDSSTRGKATLQINGGAPIALKHYTGAGSVVGNPAIEIMGPEADYGGIGGAFRTVRFKLPVEAARLTPDAPSCTQSVPDSRLRDEPRGARRITFEFLAELGHAHA